MKKIPLILFMFCSATMFGQSQKNISRTDVSSVKIFLSGAQVNRYFKTTVESGVTQLVIENLSPNIDQNSITASLSGDAMITSTSFALDYLKEERSTPTLKRLKDSLEILTDSMNRLNILEATYSEEITMLNANKNVGGTNVGLNPDNLKKAIDFFRQRMIELKTMNLAIDKKQAKLTERIKKLNDQINEENGKLNQPYGTIFVYVSAKQQTQIAVDLSYYAQGASWNPSYDLRTKDVKSPVSLMYKASVRQNTGETWEKVQVSLSTGNPSLGGNKPQLTPWYLRFVTAYNIRGSRSSETMDVQSKAMDFNKAEAAPTMMYEVVTVQENQTMTEFEIGMPYSIPSDGKEVMMDIQSHSLPALYAYSAVPKFDKDAFLMASITGWEKLSLLPGNAHVYLENSYVGQSYINPDVTTDTLQLSFGRDKRIIIKRDKVKDMNTTKFFGSNVEKEFLFETSVRNTKKEAIEITLEDQLPLSTDENIKITKGELSNGNLDEQTGMITWKLQVNPGETKKIRFGYKVKYPKDKTIPGL